MLERLEIAVEETVVPKPFGIGEGTTLPTSEAMLAARNRRHDDRRQQHIPTLAVAFREDLYTSFVDHPLGSIAPWLGVNEL